MRRLVDESLVLAVVALARNGWAADGATPLFSCLRPTAASTGCISSPSSSRFRPPPSCSSVSSEGLVRGRLMPAAAVHYRRGLVSHEEACFVCHSGYGIWGTVDAKMAGIRHMLRTAANDYEFPIEHRGPFDIDSCLNCHARSATFRAVGAHQDPDTQQALFKRELSCTGICHSASHPEDALVGPAS